MEWEDMEEIMDMEEVDSSVELEVMEDLSLDMASRAMDNLVMVNLRMVSRVMVNNLLMDNLDMDNNDHLHMGSQDMEPTLDMELTLDMEPIQVTDNLDTEPIPE